eukprot:5161335-Amphidinium_carterae.2
MQFQRGELRAELDQLHRQVKQSINPLRQSNEADKLSDNLTSSQSANVPLMQLLEMNTRAIAQTWNWTASLVQGMTKQQEVNRHHAVGVASVAGHGGLQLWLHKRLKAKRNSMTLIGFLLLCMLRMTCLLQQHMKPFATHFCAGLRSARKPRQRLVLLGDLNLRVQGFDEQVVGPYAVSTPLAGNEPRTERLISIFNLDFKRERMVLVNTWLASMDTAHGQYTWRHLKGAMAQLDYVADPAQDYRFCMSNTTVPLDGYTVDHPSEHHLPSLGSGPPASTWELCQSFGSRSRGLSSSKVEIML